MSATRTPQVSIFGNLGSDPEVKTIAGKTVTREAYNPVTDSVEEKTFTNPERTFLVFSLGVNGRDEAGEQVTSWVRCVDWHCKAEEYRKGDRVRVTGFFKVRNYLQDGEKKSIREFVVVETRLEKKRGQESVEAAVRPTATATHRASSRERRELETEPSAPFRETDQRCECGRLLREFEVPMSTCTVCVGALADAAWRRLEGVPHNELS